MVFIPKICVFSSTTNPHTKRTKTKCTHKSGHNGSDLWVHLQADDKQFWYTLDKHLPEREFMNKVRDKRGYVLLEDDIPIGLLRYNLFWDNTPFCTMLFVDRNYQGKGYGKKLMEHWENDMKSQGYKILLTSTQLDENAQHFYRKLGYNDCGGFVLDLPENSQPMELFLIKSI